MSHPPRHPAWRSPASVFKRGTNCMRPTELHHHCLGYPPYCIKEIQASRTPRTRAQCLSTSPCHNALLDNGMWAIDEKRCLTCLLSPQCNPSALNAAWYHGAQARPGCSTSAPCPSRHDGHPRGVASGDGCDRLLVASSAGLPRRGGIIVRGATGPDPRVDLRQLTLPETT
jgi:hypothetical protein